MKKLIEDRVLIINNNGDEVEFPYEIGKQHQECLNDYAEKNNYEYSSIDYLISKNNIIFYNANNGMFLSFLPSELSENQMDTLERATLKMDEITYMEAYKYSTNGTEEFIFDKDIRKNFEQVVIQSYFNKKQK